MLADRHVNTGWLSAAALRRARHLVRPDAAVNTEAPAFHGIHDAAVIPINDPSLAGIRPFILHRSQRSTIDPRVLAWRLRW